MLQSPEGLSPDPPGDLTDAFKGGLGGVADSHASLVFSPDGTAEGREKCRTCITFCITWNGFNCTILSPPRYTAWTLLFHLTPWFKNRSFFYNIMKNVYMFPKLNL